MGKKRNNKRNNYNKIIYTLLAFAIITLVSYLTEVIYSKLNIEQINTDIFGKVSYSNLADVPNYNGEICVKINDNVPYFSESDYTVDPFETYSELDYLGRCGIAYANICKETMPPQGDERGDISSVRPTGWKQAKFNGEYIYNRCHLIAYCLSDEDDNKQNLITGTRYFNVQGMLPLEKLVLDYMNKNKDNHVLYRVTPVFDGENLLANGVEMEAYSVEDNGAGISFNVFVYNIQPGADIDYSTGKLLN